MTCLHPTRRLAAALAVCALLAIAANTSWAGIIRVPHDYASIEAALNAATSGDTVLVAPGNYVAVLVVIPSGVTVLGDGEREDIWIWLYEGLDLEEGPDVVRLERVSVRAYAFSRPDVMKAQNAQCEIVNNLFVDEYVWGDNGSWIWGTGGGLIDGNHFECGRIETLFLQRGGPWIVTRNTFASACVLDAATGTTLSGGYDSLVFRQNTVVDGSVGIGDVDLDLANNIFYNAGIACWPEQAAQIHHNLFTIPLSQSCLLNGGGEGNLWETNPEFCDRQSCDYRLDPSSPAIGAGENGETLGAWPVGCGVTGVADEPERPPDGLWPFPNPTHGPVRVHVGGDATSAVVLNVTGRAVGEIPIDAGRRFVTWDGRNARGEPVEAGVYFLQIRNGSTTTATHRVVVR